MYWKWDFNNWINCIIHFIIYYNTIDNIRNLIYFYNISMQKFYFKINQNGIHIFNYIIDYIDNVL